MKLLRSDPCPICDDREELCLLCLGQIETAHEQAFEDEGTRVALAFAELGFVPEVRCEPRRTLPPGWHGADFELVA